VLETDEGSKRGDANAEKPPFATLAEMVKKRHPGLIFIFE